MNEPKRAFISESGCVHILLHWIRHICSDNVTSLMKGDMAFAERLPVGMKEGNGDEAIVMGTKVVGGAVGNSSYLVVELTQNPDPHTPPITAAIGLWDCIVLVRRSSIGAEQSHQKQPPVLQCLSI